MYFNRLVHFVYDLIEIILRKYSNVEIIIINKNKK